MALQLITELSLPLQALAAGDYEPLVGYDVWTSLFTLCNLLIVFFVAKKYLFGPVSNMISSRQNEIDEQFESAERASNEAQMLKVEYEKKLTLAEAESEEIMRRTIRNAKLKEEDILKSAREEASSVLRRANEQIELEKRAALNDIKNDVSDLAIDIAKEVLRRDIKEKEYSDMIDKFIEDLGDES